MSAYDDYPPPRRDRRQPRDDQRGYPASDDYNHRPRQPRYPSGMNGAAPVGDSGLPPPPVGDALKSKPPSALKREGSRGRVPSHVRPEFPDEASYLGSQAPDAERKNRPRDRRFRDMRDGYESEEGEHHRRNARRPHGDDGYGAADRDRRRRPREASDAYDDDRAAPARTRRPAYDDDRDHPPSRRTRDRYHDDDEPPRRRGGGGVEYGSDPVPIRRSNTDRAHRDRRADYTDDEDDYRQRRRRSHDDRDRDRRRKDDPYEDYDRRRSDRDRRHHSDDDYYNDRRDSRRKPKEIKIGKYDVGPMVEKGQKHYKTIAPIVTPIVMTMAKKYLSGGR